MIITMVYNCVREYTFLHQYEIINFTNLNVLAIIEDAK